MLIDKKFKKKQKGFIINPFISEVVAQPSIDPYWNLAQLQINGDSGTIFDQSPNNASISTTGSVVVSNTRSKYGNTSIHIASGANLKANKNHSFSYTGDFEIHIDVWFENDLTVNSIFLKLSGNFDVEAAGRLLFYRNTLNQICFDLYGIGGSVGPVVQTGQWTSIVLGRIDQWVYIGVAGALYQLPYNSATAQTITNSGTGSISIYGVAGGSGGLYFNNLRVLSCRNYLASNLATTYTPPTAFFVKEGVDTAIYDPMWKNVLARLPLNLDTGISDVSDNKRLTAIAGPGSVASNAAGFNGAGYYASGADNFFRFYCNVPVWSNWTFEARVKWVGFTSGDKAFIRLANGDTMVSYIQLAANASGSMYVYTPAIGGYYHFGFTPASDTIYSVLLQRNGRTITLYVNGSYVGQATLGTADLNGINNIFVGGGQSAAQSVFVDDVRFTLGTRVTGMAGYDSLTPVAHTQQFPTQGYVSQVALPNIPEYATDVLLDSPLFYYRLNEPSGTIVVDSSGNARNGTYVNNPQLDVAGLLSNESSNKAVRILGTEYINVPYGAWMNVGNNIALEAIIKTSTSASDTIISRRYAIVGQHVFHLRGSGGYLVLTVFNAGGGWYNWFCYSYLLSADTKYHIVVTFNGSVIKFYVNGRLMDQSYCALSFPVAPTTAIDIGRNTSVASPYETYYGVIDEVAMYAATLPYARVTSHADKAKLLLTDNTMTKALTGAVCIIALRVLKPGYTGSLIKVRRSSDNTELVIGSLNGELDTVSLLNFVGAGNGFVSIWYDQSGTGNNYTQATLASQPLIVTNGVLETYNGKPCVKFSSNAFMDSGQILDNNYHFTINFLTDTVVLTKGRDGSGTGWGFYLDSGSNSAAVVLTFGGAVTYAVTGIAPVTGFKTRRVQYIHGTTSYLKIYNGEDINNEITQAKYTLRSSTIGMEMGRLNAGYTAGRSAELVIHTSLLPDYLSDVIRNSQNSYYGL